MFSAVLLAVQTQIDCNSSFVNQIAVSLSAVHELAVRKSKNVAYF